MLDCARKVHAAAATLLGTHVECCFKARRELLALLEAADREALALGASHAYCVDALVKVLRQAREGSGHEGGQLCEHR